MNELSEFIRSKFGIDEKTFLEIFRNSPGAEGYLLGAVGEQLFKQYAEKKGFEVLRIKEKPDGGYDAKSEDARGDFYIRKKGNENDEWFVVECKSVKSNAEKRANLTNKKSCQTLLENHSIKRKNHIQSIFNRGKNRYEKAKKKHKDEKFPSFKWLENNPGAGIPNLEDLWKTKEEIKDWLDSFSTDKFTEQAYWDLEGPIRLIQTHMPSQRTDNLGIKSTGPLVTDFNILCLDLYLRTGKHEFVFANSQNLNHQASAPNHLQQNYTIDILTAKDSYKRHQLLEPWYYDIEDCIEITKPTPRKKDESQIDYR